MAERLCGTGDRFDPTGVPGPRDRLERAAPALCSEIVRLVLQSLAHAFVVGQGYANPAAGEYEHNRPDLTIPEVGGLHHRYKRLAA